MTESLQSSEKSIYNHHPNQYRLFVVEVVASEANLEAVLSQWRGEKPKLFPSWPLKECRHWLKGATHPFVVYTGHKNLEYLHRAKRLNPQQAHWVFIIALHFKSDMVHNTQYMIRVLYCVVWGIW